MLDRVIKTEQISEFEPLWDIARNCAADASSAADMAQLFENRAAHLGALALRFFFQEALDTFRPKFLKPEANGLLPPMPRVPPASEIPHAVSTRPSVPHPTANVQPIRRPAVSTPKPPSPALFAAMIEHGQWLQMRSGRPILKAARQDLLNEARLAGAESVAAKRECEFKREIAKHLTDGQTVKDVYTESELKKLWEKME